MWASPAPTASSSTSRSPTPSPSTTSPSAGPTATSAWTPLSEGRRHTERGTVTSWDDALRLATRRFQHVQYNLFTANCHSFAAHTLNLSAYGGSVDWNVPAIAVLLACRGQWVSARHVAAAWLPFVLVLVLGSALIGWAFLAGWAAFSVLFVSYLYYGTYMRKDLIMT
eukprot:SM000178S03477  [mRNA]  locus=s178:251398:252278:- [translate_table: standard]